jgi:hypothetical protein
MHPRQCLTATFKFLCLLHHEPEFPTEAIECVPTLLAGLPRPFLTADVYVVVVKGVFMYIFESLST